MGFHAAPAISWGVVSYSVPAAMPMAHVVTVQLVSIPLSAPTFDERSRLRICCARCQLAAHASSSLCSASL